MPLDPTLTALGTAAAAKKAIELVVTDLHAGARSEFRSRLNRWKAKRHIEEVYKKLRGVRMVKTVWQIDKAVDLMKFYYPARLVVGNKRITVLRLTDVPFDDSMVIEGTAGQGKSIFLRYLTSREMYGGKVLPLFMELRRLGEEETIDAYLQRTMRAYGFEVDDGTLDYLAASGRLLLFLDAFDEVPEARRTALVTELEEWRTRYPDTRIVLSSRPGSGIAQSPAFRVVKLSPLKGREYEGIIMRLTDDDRMASDVIALVRARSSAVGFLLTTPLAVTLLLFRYRQDQTVPSNTVGFYKDLFPLMLSRHDGTKPGYRRPRECGLRDGAIEDIFEALCFLTRRAQQGVFSRRGIAAYAAQAATLADRNCDAEGWLDDIIKITCLVLEDAGECSFLHKSVQEYYAASYVVAQPEHVAEKFYLAMDTHWGSWRQELLFLQEIDPYRFLKFFRIPYYKRMLGVSGCDVPVKWTERLTISAEVFTTGLEVEEVTIGPAETVLRFGGWRYIREFRWPASLGSAFTANLGPDSPRDDFIDEVSADGVAAVEIEGIGIDMEHATRALAVLHKQLLDDIDEVARVEARVSAMEFSQVPISRQRHL